MQPDWMLLERTMEIPDGQRVFLKRADDDGGVSYAIATYDRDADVFRYGARETEGARDVAWMPIPE